MNASIDRGIRATKTAMLVNAVLAAAKLVAGILGNTYALIADAVESTTDIFASTLVWSSLRVASKEADEDYPFGYGKAESLAGAAVALMIMLAAIGISIEAIREIRTPHKSPASWTLVVLAVVVAVKFVLSRRVHTVATDIGSSAVKTDAGHHMSDAVTSAAAFVGISIAVIGGPGYEQADDWAALFAAGVIAYNGVNLLRPTLDDLMDRAPGPDIFEPVQRAARSVTGVLATEKLAIRKSGLGYRVTIHVQTDGHISLQDAHILSGMVKGAIKAAVPQVQAVLVHMEPYEG